MLKLAQFKDKNKILRFCSDDLLGSYIACRLETYGFDYDFSIYWLSEENGQINAVVSSFDNYAVVLCNENVNADELKSFIEMIGFKSVMFYKNTADKCGFDNLTYKQSFTFKAQNSGYNVESNIDLKKAYSLISKSIPNSFGDTNEAYLSFLSDFTYRKNRNHARIKGITDNSDVVSCALTCAESDLSAVISGVACDEAKRGGGFGKKTVLSLADELSSELKTVYVIALNESAETFYKKIGFEEYKKIAYWNR